MSNIRAHELHQMVRSWLLAEDPYGMNQRQEPTFGTPQPAGAVPAPGRSPVAQAAGESAVANATAPDPRGETAGPEAVAKQLFGGQGARYSEAERDPRAQAWGENAVDKALNPPTGSGGGFWMPGEAADTASAVGEQAVAGSLAKKARSKMARGRLKDPVDEDDRQPE